MREVLFGDTDAYCLCGYREYVTQTGRPPSLPEAVIEPRQARLPGDKGRSSYEARIKRRDYHREYKRRQRALKLQRELDGDSPADRAR